MLALATMALSAAGFLLLLVALWSDGDDGAWRWFGSAALAALACSHASLVSSALRSSDGPAIEALAKASITLGVVDSFFGILAVSGAVEDIDEGVGRLMASVAVAPRVGAPSTAAEASTPSRSNAAPRPLAAEVLAAADRIEALNGDPGNRAAEIRRECERLRELARSHSG